MTTYGYRRVSSETQEEGTSLDSQATKINGLAMLAELGDVTMVTDVCSGSVPLDQRSNGGAMWSSLKAGDSVIVVKLDRAFRNAGDALTKADELKKMGVALYLLDMGTEPVTNNGTSRMFFGMLALVAEFERTRILERTAEGRAAKKAQEGHTGGSRPFGYDVEGKGKEARLVPRADEQAAIAEMLELKKQPGMSSRAIADRMKHKGFTLSHVTVSRLIRS